MNKPKTPTSHVLQRKSEKHFETLVPDEWVAEIPSKDYGIDYKVEIAVNNEMTGLNFSVQLKSTQKSKDTDYCYAMLKQSTLNYYSARLEPVMLVCYVDEDQEAYWCWINDLNLDLSGKNRTYSIQISKVNVLSKIVWQSVTDYVQGHFNKRKLIGPFDIMALNDLGRSAWKAFYMEDHDQAVYLFRSLLKTDKKNKAAKQALAWSLYLRCDYPEALRVINDALTFDTSSWTYQTKGCILAEYGRSRDDKNMLMQARDIFKECIDEAASATTYYNYGNVLSSLKNYVEAIEPYKISLKLLPNFAFAWKNLGTCYHQLGNFEEEIKCYDKALSIDPKLVEALISKAITLTKVLGQHDQALALFRKALRQEDAIQTGYAHAYFYIAYAYEMKCRASDALKWIEKGLALAPSDQYLLSCKAKILINNWQSNRKIRAAAVTFFTFRFEVQNDPKTLYFVIKTNGYKKKAAFELIKQHTGVLHDLELTSLDKYKTEWEKVVEILPYWNGYLDFRYQYPLTRYSADINSTLYSVSTTFLSLVDVTFAMSFSQALNFYHETQQDPTVPITISGVLLGQMPQLLGVLLKKKKYKQEVAVEIFAWLFLNYSKMVLREIGLQCAYLQTKLNLGDVDLLSHIAHEQKAQFRENVLLELNRCLGLLQEEV